MNLYIKPDIESNLKMLWYEGVKGFARREELSINNLKRAIEELLSDKEIIARIAEYKNLINQLDNDEQIKHLKAVIREFHTRIYGGQVLGGYPACDLCDPDIPVDMS